MVDRQRLLPSKTDPGHSAAAARIRYCIVCGSRRRSAGAGHAASTETNRAAAGTSTGTAAADHPSSTGALPAGSEAAGDAVCLLEPVIVGRAERADLGQDLEVQRADGGRAVPTAARHSQRS